jgi:5-formyltetrahydrofolate cyclo-ligase
MNKSLLRKQMKKKRDSLSTAFKEEASERISAKFYAEFSSANRVLLYSDINNEVMTEKLTLKLIENGVKVYLPKVEGSEVLTGPYDYEGLQTGFYGVKEPVVIDNRVDFDVVAVPALAFDSELYRLGYGGGFYDRLLPKLTKSTKVGLGYDFQIVSSILRESHDYPLDMLITEDYIYRRSR